MFKRCAPIALALLAACAAPLHRPPAASAPSAVQSLPALGTYRIDAARSELRVLVYRGGALANLGHNHVVVNRNMSGTVTVGEALADSYCAFSVPVADFTVDDAEARREEGQDFLSEVSAEAKAGTLHNMLGASVLNAADNPAISVRSVAFARIGGSMQATLMVRTAGHDTQVSAPFILGSDAQGLTASADFELKQSALGMTPFSLMLGALAVRDVMHIKIKLAAAIK